MIARLSLKIINLLHRITILNESLHYSRPLSKDSKYIVCDAKVRRIFYIASDLSKTLREFNNMSPAI